MELAGKVGKKKEKDGGEATKHHIKPHSTLKDVFS